MGVAAPHDAGDAGNGNARTKTPERMFMDAAAGALAGCIARVVVGPLDVIKIRFQVQLEPIKGTPAVKALQSKYTGFWQALRTIAREEGVQGLWRGTVPGLLLTVPYTAVQFVALQQCRDTAARMGLTASPSTAPWVPFVTGALAGAAGTVASYPFDLLRTTMAAQGEPRVYNDMLQAAGGIVRERGVRGLYSGLGITLVEIMPYAALQFGLYDALQAAWQAAKVQHIEQGVKRQQGGQPGPSMAQSVLYDSRTASFVCGLLAGLCAKLASHPLDVVKKRYQVAGLQRSLRYGARVQPRFALQSLGSCLADIYRQEGVAGLWKGSVPSMIKAAPSAAITFTAYEAILTWLLAASQAAQRPRSAGTA